MSQAGSGKTRMVFALGLALGAGVLASAASLVDTQHARVLFDGTDNRLQLIAIGSADPAWNPSPAEWEAAARETYQIGLGDDDRAGTLGPGDELELRVAVRNASPRLASSLSLEILDPHDRHGHIDPATGGFVELFTELEFTVRDGGKVLLAGVPAADLTRVSLEGVLPAGEYRVLDVAIHVPEELDNRWQQATTDVQFLFQGESV